MRQSDWNGRNGEDLNINQCKMYHNKYDLFHFVDFVSEKEIQLDG